MTVIRKRVSHSLTVVCSVIALSAATGAMADQPADKPASPAMKVKIDKDTGKMRNATAAEEATMAPDATERQLAADWWNATVPGNASDGIITLSDGTQMKRMDVESLQAFAVTLDDDGNLVGAHVSVDADVDAPVSETVTEENARETH